MPSNRSDAPKKVVAVAGVVGTDPQWREAGDAGDVLEFRLAVQTSYDEGAEAKWFDVTVWNEKLQESVEAEVFRGAKVAVEGTYSSREYDGKTYFKINAAKVGLIEWLQRSKGNSSSRPAARPAREEEEEERPTRRQASRSSSRSSSSRSSSSRKAAEDDTEDDDLPW